MLAMKAKRVLAVFALFLMPFVAETACTVDLPYGDIYVDRDWGYDYDDYYVDVWVEEEYDDCCYYEYDDGYYYDSWFDWF